MATSAQEFSLAQWRHKDGLPSGTIYALMQTPDGFLWLGTADGLVRFDGFQFVTFLPAKYGLRPLGQVRVLSVMQDGALLVGSESGMLLRLKDGAVTTRHSLGSPVTAAMRLASGSILVETTDAHYYCVGANGQVLSSTCPQSKASDGKAITLAEEMPIRALVSRSDPTVTIRTILAGAGGERWVATVKSGIFLIRNGLLAGHFTERNGLADNRVWDLVEDRDGSVWVGTQNGLNRIQANQFFNRSGRSVPGNAPDFTARPIAESPIDKAWRAQPDGSLLHHDATGDQLFSAKDGLPPATIAFLSPQADGTLWIASDAGIAFYDGRHLLRWDKRAGLPGERLLWVLPDRLGHLWVAYHFGLAEFSIDELMRQAHDNSTLLRYQMYDDGDGLTSNPEVHGPIPVTLASDGKLWFTTADGLATIDPARAKRELGEPPTHLLQVTADGLDVPIERVVRFKPLTHAITFNYTGISLSSPLKVRYRYRLDGFDEPWQEAGAQRSATYTNLHPGAYRFHVLASSNGGWNGSGTSLAFEVQPAYYQTLWFKAASVIATITLVILVFRLRVRSKERVMRTRYEDRLAERSRIAQDLHDNLIQEMMGVSLQLEVADELTPNDVAAKPFIGQALALAQGVIGNGRSALGILRQKPLHYAELVRMLEATAQAMADPDVVRLAFTKDGAERLLAAAVSEDLLQIAREALRNAIRHTGCEVVHIRIEYGIDRFALILTDQGQGMPDVSQPSARAGHFGIQGMQERAARIGATLDLETAIDAGTAWRITLAGTIAYYAEDAPASTRRLRTLGLRLRSRGRQ